MKAYRNGCQVEYLGTSQVLHGGLFYDFVWLEGPKAGQAGVTQTPPPAGQEVPPGAPVAPEALSIWAFAEALEAAPKVAEAPFALEAEACRPRTRRSPGLFD